MLRLRTASFSADALAEHRGAMEHLFAQELDVLIVRSFISSDLLSLAADRVEKLCTRAIPVVPGADIRMIGLPLQWNRPSLEEARKATAEVHDACNELFGPTLDLPRRTREALSELSNQPLVNANVNGIPYCPMTLRFFPPGTCVGPHHERTQFTFEPYAAMREYADSSVVLSFFVTVASAPRGGELVVYGLEFGERGAGEIHDGVGETGLLLGRFPPNPVHLEPGDLIVFNSGRLAHQVTTVDGPRIRCTLGGLLAKRRNQHEVVTWA